MAKFQIKKVGNHWYPEVIHKLGYDISLDEKIDRYLNLFNTDTVTVLVEEIPIIMNTDHIFCINEEDLTRYYITDDEFNIRFSIDEHKFTISSYLYYCLTQQFDINPHKEMYRIELIV